MTSDVPDREFEAVFALSPQKRYWHALKRVADLEELWLLGSGNEFVVGGDDEGNEYMPIWPYARYAAACATGAWANNEPVKIELDVWLRKWVPGFERDSLKIAVFPNLRTNAVVVSPEQFKNDLQAELDKYEF